MTKKAIAIFLCILPAISLAADIIYTTEKDETFEEIIKKNISKKVIKKYGISKISQRIMSLNPDLLTIRISKDKELVLEGQDILLGRGKSKHSRSKKSGFTFGLTWSLQWREQSDRSNLNSKTNDYTIESNSQFAPGLSLEYSYKNKFQSQLAVIYSKSKVADTELDSDFNFIFSNQFNNLAGGLFLGAEFNKYSYQYKFNIQGTLATTSATTNYEYLFGSFYLGHRFNLKDFEINFSILYGLSLDEEITYSGLDGNNYDYGATQLGFIFDIKLYRHFILKSEFRKIGTDQSNVSHQMFRTSIGYLF